MALDEAAKTALFNALTWIESTKSDASVDTENIEVGVQCLTEAFGLKLQDASHKNLYEVVGTPSFPEIFSAGMKALGVATKGVDDSSFENDPAITKNPALWKKWVAKLGDKGFFNGAPLGSDEYKSRMKKALAKYKERVADAKPATLTKEEKEKLAEEAKAKGNSALNGGDYETAAKLYGTALAHSSDGPNSHIYYANLAAADMYLGRYTEVVDNCEKAIALKPSYVKAYSRMGNAQVHLKDFEGAIDSFRRGLEVDASNAACRDGLADAERKSRQQSAPTVRGGADAGAEAPGAGAAGAGGMPDLSSLASMFGGGGGGGGGGGLADLLSNPAMQQMAASMMQNPAMMQMAQNMMQNPDALSSMMGNLGGGGGAGGAPGGGMPDMAGMANAFRNSPEIMAARSDPELQDFFRDVDQDGPSAAMRHMSNPKVSQLIQNAMAGMQG